MLSNLSHESKSKCIHPITDSGNHRKRRHHKFFFFAFREHISETIQRQINRKGYSNNFSDFMRKPQGHIATELQKYNGKENLQKQLYRKHNTQFCRKNFKMTTQGERA